MCDRTCDSVWFKIVNATDAAYYAKICDKIFLSKYADVTYNLFLLINLRKYHCNDTPDPFYIVKEEIGKVATDTIAMGLLDLL